MQINRFLSLAVSALLLGGCLGDDPVAPPISIPGAAVVMVVFQGHPADTLHVLVTDSATIAQAKAYVATGTGPHMITGPIVRGSGYDTRYPFRYLPDSVRIADAGMEICDGEPMRTVSALNQFFEWATGNASANRAIWCPWSSKPIVVYTPGIAL